MPVVLNQSGSTPLPVEVPREALEEFCQRHHICRLAFFGSVLRDDFGPESDIDVLVEFEPGHTPGLPFFSMDVELSRILGRKVDLNTPGSFRPALRAKIEQQALAVYSA